MEQATSIAREINQVQESLAARVARTSVVVREKLTPRSSALAEFGVYDRAVARQRGSRPHTRFVFYPAVGNHDRIGSVAIYAANVTEICVDLRTKGHLLGRVIASATVEYGARPFVDVTFRA